MQYEHLVIPLYYHDSPVSIITAITGAKVPDIITSASQTALTEARKTLAGARGALAKSRAELESVQSRIRTLNAVLDPELKELASARADQRVTAKARYKAELDKGVAENKLQAAEKRLELRPKDENLAEAKRQAERDFVNANEVYLNADSASKKAEARVAEVAGRISNQEDASKGAVGQLAKLQDDAQSKSAAVAEAKKDYVTAAIAEAIAFGQVRKSESIALVKEDVEGGPPNIACAFPESRRIYLSGEKKWVRELAARIDQFDRPEPQAMLTLWSLEMSSQATENGVESVTEALRVIDEELKEAREGVRQEIDSLQKAILKVVTEFDGNSSLTGSFESHISYYSDPVLDLMINPESGEFHGKRLKTLRSRVANYIVPDPAEVSSLAHALVVFSMLSPYSQELVLYEISKARKSKIDNKNENAKSTSSTSDQKDEKKDPFLSRTLTRLKATSSPKKSTPKEGEGNSPPPTESLENLPSNTERGPDVLTPFSRELALAFRARGEARIASDFTLTFSAFRAAAEGVESRNKSAEKKARLHEKEEKYLEVLATKLKKARKAKDKKKIASLEKELETHKKNRDTLKEEIDELIAEGQQLTSQMLNHRAKSKELLEMLTYLSGVRFSFNIDTATAKTIEDFKRFSRKNQAGLKFSTEAVINEKLKGLIGGANDDLQARYIEPAYRSIREQLKRKGVQVGILQRTSILSSNRRLSQVDPTASASLEVTKRQDILAATLQLGEILATAETGGLLLALQNQDAKEEKRPPEVYGLTTGNRFEVRPFVDPTGQALSFDFDFVGSTTVRDPDDSSNPQLNRIEKHTINTRVQLSNMEVREVSRFLVNAKVGVPEKRHGGIPVLNDIPIIQDIPLIGWFSRTYGRAPVVQQSLVLGQTSIIPTIEILSDLMVHHKRVPLILD